MERFFTRVASAVSRYTGQPITFMVALAIVLIWGISGPIFKWSDTWQLVINTGTTIVTFLMVFVIQNAQNRDASAVQVKLDELLRSIADARDSFIGIEHLTDQEICEIRERLERDLAEHPDRAQAVNQQLGRLIKRR
ncbi:low affinity iron permease family protein [Novosphingobium album (ex Liu et al. 2023)]|uniref:Low affinity iron permease family protein n=1 Tax=Novosphingobium album (ex Liu et al. 2023) TaxID=3031130 RepID=A0ABT5WUA3_9SPHN|nr:low affinity iron permease family protein [Novosphingobium album (ex Liu et al. 2023)]MDE8653437.1 low affinity iron permease family protein [Novosphingobium album (ex Liu et al. 2023)]